MSVEALFQRFIEQSPITVMLRGTLENMFSPETIDEIFAKFAHRQRPSELLFSSVVDLLSLVVLRERRSVNHAYICAKEQFQVSIASVYNKLNGTETAVCRELVRQPAQKLVEVVDVLAGLTGRQGKRKPKLRGYRTRILDGNHLTSTDHRLEVLRRTRSGPLPGQVLAVLDPDRMLIVDLFPWEDGHSQERVILPEVLLTVQYLDLWIADRNFCTTGFLFGLSAKQASFIIRQHASTLVWDQETKQKKIGRCETGVIYEQKLLLQQGDKTLWVRRITIKLNQPTESGQTEIHLLTNLSSRTASAFKVAELYLTRWTIENAFQEIEQALRSEINTLGYPGAALLGFSIAVMTYNALSVVKWAVEAEQGATIQREEISGYYLAAVVSSDYCGMMIALPAKDWTVRFADLTPRQLVNRLRACARHVKPHQFRKTKRGPKKPRPPRTRGNIYHHVSTARLIAAKK